MSKLLIRTIGFLSWGILSLSAGLAPPASGQEQQPVCSDGQAGIVGVVLDGSTNVPVAGAYVSVEESDWAWLTTDSGRFLLCEIGAGIHLVTVERLGYATHTVRVEADTSGNPVSLRVMPEPILLEGLAIVMDRFERSAAKRGNRCPRLRSRCAGEQRLLVGRRLPGLARGHVYGPLRRRQVHLLPGCQGRPHCLSRRVPIARGLGPAGIHADQPTVHGRSLQQGNAHSRLFSRFHAASRQHAPLTISDLGPRGPYRDGESVLAGKPWPSAV